MYWLMNSKIRVGKKLNSEAILKDADCTKTCFYLSIILLISSLLYKFLQIGFIDAAGSLGIAYYSFMEGKEAFEQAKTYISVNHNMRNNKLQKNFELLEEEQNK
jgi:divalent metal cation (Fe/Co/Zn/Cd) transporter